MSPLSPPLKCSDVMSTFTVTVLALTCGLPSAVAPSPTATTPLALAESDTEPEPEGMWGQIFSLYFQWPEQDVVTPETASDAVAAAPAASLAEPMAKWPQEMDETEPVGVVVGGVVGGGGVRIGI